MVKKSSEVAELIGFIRNVSQMQINFSNFFSVFHNSFVHIKQKRMIDRILTFNIG